LQNKKELAHFLEMVTQQTLPWKVGKKKGIKPRQRKRITPFPETHSWGGKKKKDKLSRSTRMTIEIAKVRCSKKSHGLVNGTLRVLRNLFHTGRRRTKGRHTRRRLRTRQERANIGQEKRSSTGKKSSRTRKEKCFTARGDKANSSQKGENETFSECGPLTPGGEKKQQKKNVPMRRGGGEDSLRGRKEGGSVAVLERTRVFPKKKKAGSTAGGAVGSETQLKVGGSSF